MSEEVSLITQKGSLKQYPHTHSHEASKQYKKAFLLEIKELLVTMH